MNTRRFVDTNILLYSISREPAEAAKRESAIEVLSGSDVVFSTQVLQEFYVEATRPNRVDALSHDTASGLLRAWTRFPVQDISVPIVMAALGIQAAHGFSYWDSVIIAAAQAMGCREVLTEDMTHGRRVGEVTIINPFRDA